MVKTGAKAEKLSAYLRAGWISECEKLRSGRYRVRGEEMMYEGRSAPGELDPDSILVKNRIDVRVTFDWPAGKSKHSIYWGEYHKGIWLMGPERAAVWPNIGAGVVTLINPSEKRLSFARFLDARTMGFATTTTIARSMVLEECQEFIGDLAAPISVAELGKGRFRITWEGPMEQQEDWHWRESIVINEKRGFSIESRERRTFSDKRDVDTLFLKTHAVWDKFGDVWLPVSVETYEPQGLSTLQLAFEWDDVNEPIPAAEFEFENSGIPDGVLIADKRLSPDDPVILGKIGIEEYAIHSPNPKTPLVSQPVSKWTYALYGANAIVFVAIAAFYIVRRRRST